MGAVEFDRDAVCSYLDWLEEETRRREIEDLERRAEAGFSDVSEGTTWDRLAWATLALRVQIALSNVNEVLRKDEVDRRDELLAAEALHTLRQVYGAPDDAWAAFLAEHQELSTEA